MKTFSKTVMFIIVMLTFSSQADASVTPLWFAGQLRAGARPTAAQVAPFVAASGLARQRVGSIPWWTYVKGSRSGNGSYPESWYVHQDGVRVRDSKFGFFVMDPANLGWDAVVAKACGARCFVDGIGATSLGRTTPRLRMSDSRWVTAVGVELRYLVGHGHKVLPNSVSTPSVSYLRIAGQGSTESFRGLSSLALLAAGNVWVVAKRDCGYMLAAFLIGRDSGDVFACSEPGTAPWQVPAVMAGASLGNPTGATHRAPTGYTRAFQRGTVTARFNGSYSIVR